MGSLRQKSCRKYPRVLFTIVRSSALLWLSVWLSDVMSPHICSICNSCFFIRFAVRVAERLKIGPCFIDLEAQVHTTLGTCANAKGSAKRPIRQRSAIVDRSSGVADLLSGIVCYRRNCLRVRNH